MKKEKESNGGKQKVEKKRKKKRCGQYLSVNLVVLHSGQQFVSQNHLILLGKDLFRAINVHQFGNDISRATTLGGFG